MLSVVVCMTNIIRRNILSISITVSIIVIIVGCIGVWSGISCSCSDRN